MKKSLLLIAFLISMFSSSQIPTDAIRSYSFINGSLQNTGTMTGGDLTTSSSAYNVVNGFDAVAQSALDLNGTVFNGSVSTVSSQESSYSLWIKVAPSTVGSGRILNHRESGNDGVFIYHQNTNIVCQFGDSTGNSKIITGPAINDGLWHHLAVVIKQVVTSSNFRGYEGTMYLDGATVATDITNGTSASSNPNWLTFFTNPIFSLNDALSNAVFYQDTIDEVQVYDRALTVAEITALANNSTSPPLTQVFVDIDAIGANDGTSWADAYTSLQTALQLNPGGEFWIADGRYTPGTGSTTTFDLNTAATELYGGFNGTETMRSQRDPSINITVLSGDGSNDDFDVVFSGGGGRSENSINVFQISADNCVLDGLTISDGNADGATATTGEGAAIFATTGDISINNCVFEKHVVNRGGIIRAINQSGTINIENTIFRDNLGTDYPLFYSRASGGLLDINFTNCLVYNNRKEGNSNNTNNFGLFWFRQDLNESQSATFTNCTFTENTFRTIGSFTPVINASENNGGNLTMKVNNSIFWRNLNIDFSSGTVDAIGNGTNMNSASIYDIKNSIDENTFSTISNNGTSRININNIASDPLFTDATNNDFSLQSGSPAIDTGDSQFVTTTTDIAGNARIINNTVDMGAYEFNSSSSGPNTDDFIWTWRTTATNESITIPMNINSSLVYNFTVNWGDGSVDNTIYNNSAAPVHTYSTTGDYDIVISGDFHYFKLNLYGEQDKCIDVKQWGNQQWQSFFYTFEDASNIQFSATDVPDISLFISNGMESVFFNATNFNSDISMWDVSMIQSFGSCFQGASSFNQNLSNWDISNATSMRSVFQDASSFNQPLDSWDVSNVTDFNEMFLNATSFNQDLNSWDVSNATNFGSTFQGASSFNGNITSWDVSSANFIFSMFRGASSFNQDISVWQFTNATDFFRFFASATSFNQDISSWDMSNVTRITSMFEGASSFNQSLSNWDTSSITDMRSSFFQNSSFNQDISNWDTSNVTDMRNMFFNTPAFNQDLSQWDVSSLTQAGGMIQASGLSSENYSRMLNSWSQQSLQSNVTFSIGPNYCSAAQAGRDILTNTFGWLITDGGVDTSINCTLSNEDLQLENSVNLYPNPVSNTLNISIDNNALVKAVIYNLQGQQILISKTEEVNVQDLKIGMYIIKVTTETGAVASQQFIKK